MIPLLLLAALTPLAQRVQAADSLSSILSSYGLTAATYNFTFPSETLNSEDANTFLQSNWDIYGNKVDFGHSDIVFSPDPDTTTSTLVRRAESSTSTAASSSSTTRTSTKSSTKSSTKTSSTSTNTYSTTYPQSTNLAGEDPVLRIEYPQGSYSKKTGGTQFYSEPLNATSATASSVAGNASSNGQYERMLLSYDIWFPTGYAWNLGGKLPGLRGGPDPRGCSGGSQTDGTSCFSTRLMWRSSGAGEVYAYIPTTQNNFCSTTNVICNSDYGTSLARGSFSFVTGKWQTIYLLVILNEVGIANGVVQLWYNNVLALSFTQLELRASSSIESIGGLYFSTFFGGDDDTWATPTTQYTYYKNINLYAGAGASNSTGSAISAATSTTVSKLGVGMGLMIGAIMCLGLY